MRRLKSAATRRVRDEVFARTVSGPGGTQTEVCGYNDPGEEGAYLGAINGRPVAMYCPFASRRPGGRKAHLPEETTLSPFGGEVWGEAFPAGMGGLPTLNVN